MKLNNLQILRGISALMVCCFHFRGDLNISTFEAGDLLFRKGSIGVPIFFVISGFIMAFTTEKLDTDKQNYFSNITLFFKKRIIRIVPLYYLLTFGWIILGGGITLYFSDQLLLSRLIHSLLFIQHKNQPPVLYLGWSLNYEMFFFVIFGVSLLFRRKRYLFLILFFIFSYTAGSFIIIENPFWKMMTNSLNVYFVMGVVLNLFLKRMKLPYQLSLIISVILILIFSAQFFNLFHIKNHLLLLLVVSGFVFSFLLLDYRLKIKGNYFLILLGDISYSLYLSHPFVDILFRRFKVEDFYRVPFFIFKIFVAIGVAVFLYHFIEKKITNYLKLKLKI
ncbi:acyltransferase family protein [Chryseobacterium taihuense]|uniref:Peptidoglycan/LPS O-acetylase OafA/YrhL, contains acyltransferase and SGNH-hydrolase domains n=1 Tax=Chryseobacterium taihuense TaxID=1141221 RepID=A0ABY0QTL2_9FLAO|nr:acyltransferase [Chryseobacterium taihuense]SDL86001.1 Peptidoglycan/LPS O-acetylase OafA/YrhL, contains acyltransferase and SGNH-hydrolase domains [Chryseobacterium taihuense]